MSNDRTDRKVHEHDPVVLLRDIPDQGLVAGDTGTVVYVYQNHQAYEVQFPNPDERPRYLVVTVEPHELLKLQPASRSKGAPT